MHCHKASTLPSEEGDVDVLGLTESAGGELVLLTFDSPLSASY
jgi:hypothetical protein